MDSKKRSALCAAANGIDASFQIGKGNLSENMIKSISEALEVRELVKISVLKGAEDTPEELMETLAARLNAEPVRAIGSKIILYRKNKKKDFISKLNLD